MNRYFFKSRCLRLIISILTVLVLSNLSHSSELTELTIGIIPEQNVFKQLEKYELLGKYIENKADIKIKFTVLSRYGNIIDSFKRKNLDGAFWGSFAGAMAIKELGVQPLVRPVRLDGLSSDRSYIFVHKYSVINSVDRMRDAEIAFVDKTTTTGYVYPVAYFMKHGVENVENFFKEYYFTGSHDAAVYAVLNKEVDIGCAKSTVYEQLSRNDQRIKNDLVILAQSAPVPSNGLGVTDNVDVHIKVKLKNVLLGMKTDPEGSKVLEEFGAENFIETTEKDYVPVFDYAKKAGIDMAGYNLINN